MGESGTSVSGRDRGRAPIHAHGMSRLLDVPSRRPCRQTSGRGRNKQFAVPVAEIRQRCCCRRCCCGCCGPRTCRHAERPFLPSYVRSPSSNPDVPARPPPAGTLLLTATDGEAGAPRWRTSPRRLLRPSSGFSGERRPHAPQPCAGTSAPPTH